jgi:hypothetical protein
MAPPERPWWFFTTCVCRGSGPVDIPTHVVDQAQWLVDGDTATPALLSPVRGRRECPRRRFGGSPARKGFRGLQPFVDGDSLSYRCNAELVYRIGRITASAATRWNLARHRVGRCLPQRRSRDSRRHSPGAERPHGPPPQVFVEASRRCR